jgi:transposase
MICDVCGEKMILLFNPWSLDRTWQCLSCGFMRRIYDDEER